MVVVAQMMADFFFKLFPWQLLKSIVLILGQSKNTFWITSKELIYVNKALTAGYCKKVHFCYKFICVSGLVLK